MEFFAKLFFAFYALVILLGGVMAVASKSLVRALVGLILTLFGVAGMYLLLNAPFIAFMQLLIYVGAVVILIFFAIMLTRPPAGGEEAELNPIRKHLWALMAALLPGFVLAYIVVTAQPEQVAPGEVPVALLGQGLMEPYVLAFELISVVLFIAMSAAVLLAFKPRRAK